MGVVPQALAPLTASHRTGPTYPDLEKLPSAFEDETIIQIAKKHNRTVAQVCLAWNMQRGVVVLPRSDTKEQMLDNLAASTLELDNDDMQLMRSLDMRR